MTIVLQESLRGLFYAPFYAALALDAYAEEGVEVRFASAPTPGAAAMGLLDGSVDVTWGGPMRLNQTYARDPGCALVCFAEVVTRDPFLVVGQTAKPDFRLADLTRIRLATVSEVPTPWLCLQEDLRRAGFDPDAVDRAPARSMAENVAALRRGEVDAVQVFEPLAEELLASGDGHIWYAAASRGATSYTTFYARRDVIAARRPELLAMTRALHRTLAWVHAASPQRLADVVAEYFPSVPAHRLAGALGRYQALGIWGHDVCLPRSGYDRLAAGLVSGGFVAAAAPYDEVVDNTLAREVLRANPPPLIR